MVTYTCITMHKIKSKNLVGGGTQAGGISPPPLYETLYIHTYTQNIGQLLRLDAQP